MVIGAEDDPLAAPLAGELADPVEGVLAVELLLLLLLHAARTPTESATAPNATAFLENQGRCALTPGSSFLNRSFFFGVEHPDALGPASSGYICGLHAPRHKRGEMYTIVSCAVHRRGEIQQSFA
jgi:hypothetical protein